jgi:hypothetical protein
MAWCKKMDGILADEVFVVSPTVSGVQPDFRTFDSLSVKCLCFRSLSSLVAVASQVTANGGGTLEGVANEINKMKAYAKSDKPHKVIS